MSSRVKRSLTEVREELFALLAKVSTGIVSAKDARKRAREIDQEIRPRKKKRRALRRSGEPT